MNGITKPLLKRSTECQEERAARDLALYNEYKTLAADPNQARTEIHRYLREKYRLHSSGTTYAIIKRVQQRLNKELFRQDEN